MGSLQIPLAETLVDQSEHWQEVDEKVEIHDFDWLLYLALMTSLETYSVAWQVATAGYMEWGSL